MIVLKLAQIGVETILIMEKVFWHEEKRVGREITEEIII